MGGNQPEGVAATPIQSAKLWAGAFNSTGLISKVNRNPEADAKKMVPPDTPCKKHPNNFATFPPPLGSAIKKKKKNNNRNSFGGVPSTPFNPTSAEEPDTFGFPGKGLSIFQRGSASRSARRGSFLLLDEEDDAQSFGDGYEKVNPLDADAPPTPTKNLLTTSLSNVSEQSIESPSANRTYCPPTSAVRPSVSRNSTGKFALGDARCFRSQPRAACCAVTNLLNSRAGSIVPNPPL
jgi:mitosis inhibitor protein kinase SWE1